ncbi:ATP-dependent DNA helicase sgs1 [Mortierella sp. AM989]|nr:ATP-dependent DNA helicase sgs1 [Mortierella sp. AM989]
MDSVIRGKFKVIFTTSEMIFKSTKLFNLLRNDSWRKKLRAVIVDEAHCVTSWADAFRPGYGRIGELRTKLLDHVSFVSMSATLPPVELFKIKESIGCSPDVRVFNVTNDRTNIKYHVVEFAYTMASYQDLDFVLDFQKTIVYFESDSETENARKYFTLSPFNFNANTLPSIEAIKEIQHTTGILNSERMVTAFEDVIFHQLVLARAHKGEPEWKDVLLAIHIWTTNMEFSRKQLQDPEALLELKILSFIMPILKAVFVQSYLQLIHGETISKATRADHLLDLLHNGQNTKSIYGRKIDLLVAWGTMNLHVASLSPYPPVLQKRRIKRPNPSSATKRHI